MISMKRLVTLLALALVATAVGATTAQAAVVGVSISPAGEISQSSNGTVAFRESGGLTISCNLTLRGTLSTTLVSSLERNAIGSVTAVTWSGCSGGEVRSVLNTPWPITIVGFLQAEARGVCNVLKTIGEANKEALCGVLLQITKTSFLLSALGGFVECLYGGTTESVTVLAPLTKVRGTTSSYTLGALTIIAGRNTFRRVSGSCGATGTMTGSFNAASPTQTATAL